MAHTRLVAAGNLSHGGDNQMKPSEFQDPFVRALIQHCGILYLGL
jgi:hypothetical protein